MNDGAFAYLGLFFAVLVATSVPLGCWIAEVLRGAPPVFLRWLVPVERVTYRLAGIDPSAEMGWRVYAGALLAFHLLGFGAVFALQLLQGFLPLNPQNFGAVPPGVAVNTAVSFVTNTNWQAYSGEASPWPTVRERRG